MSPVDESRTMSAARFHGAGDVRLEQVPVPRPRPDEALVEVEWVGLCGSDVEEWRQGPVVVKPPVTLGHEIVGVVSAPAADGSGPEPGTRVVVDVVTGCGRCYWCRRHDEGLCADVAVTGQHVDGGLARLVTARAGRLIVVPPGVDGRSAALAEPTAVAVRALRKAGELVGRGVLVLGGGTIGMLCAQVARASGAADVAVVEPAPARRWLIESWGIATAWADDAAGRAEAVAGLFPGRGVDVVLESAGRPGSAGEAARLVRRGGTVVLTGILPPPEELDTLDLVLGEKTLVGSAAHMWDDDVAVAVGLIASGRVDVAALITHTVPMAEIDRAFALLADPAAGVIKLLVEVTAEAIRAR